MENAASSYLRFLEGDNDGFIELVRKYNYGLILFINTILNDIHMSEEAADDTFLKLYVKKPKYRSEYSFKTWLYAIGRNTAINYAKKFKKQQYVPIEEFCYYSDETDIESEYLKDEQNIILHNCIKALNADYSQILYLVYFEGMTVEETGKIVGKTSRQVTQILYRAKKALKEEMERRGEHGQI